jgi:hypothetical protein
MGELKTGALSGAAGLRDLSAGRGVPFVDYAGWQRIDAEERRRASGQAAGEVLPPRRHAPRGCGIGLMLAAHARQRREHRL